jgi:hypothetical protein
MGAWIAAAGAATAAAARSLLQSAHASLPLLTLGTSDGTCLSYFNNKLHPQLQLQARAAFPSLHFFVIVVGVVVPLVIDVYKGAVHLRQPFQLVQQALG